MRHFAKAALASLSIILNAGALAATTVSLQPATGHPNLAVTVTGSGFGVSEAVDIYIDTVDTLLAVSSATGALSVPITIPAAAQPGFHYVTGIGRKSGSAAQAKFNVSTSWIESGFGAAHLAWNPYENTLNPSAVLSLEQLWATPVGGDAYGSPAVVAGKVYIASANGGGLYSLNATTGAVIWHQTTAPVDNFFSSAAVAKNVIYILGNSGHLYAFNALNGTLMWTKALASPGLASPVVVNGVIYVASGPSLYALDASGNLIWGETLGTSGANLTGSAAVVNGPALHWLGRWQPLRDQCIERRTLLHPRDRCDQWRSGGGEWRRLPRLERFQDVRAAGAIGRGALDPDGRRILRWLAGRRSRRRLRRGHQRRLVCLQRCERHHLMDGHDRAVVSQASVADGVLYVGGASGSVA